MLMRLYREMDDATKLRISQRLKGRTMSDSHIDWINKKIPVSGSTYGDRCQKTIHQAVIESEPIFLLISWIAKFSVLMSLSDKV